MFARTSKIDGYRVLRTAPPSDERPDPRTALRSARIAVAIGVALTLLLHFVPYGRTIAYPLILVSTVAHELGHGITALLVGAGFESLRIETDASGVATITGLRSGIATAITAAGGLLGPAIVAAIALRAILRPRASKFLLGLSSAVLVATLLLVGVEGWFGFFFVAVLAIGLGIAATLPTKQTVTLTAFLAVQLALSVFTRADYLFVAATSSGGVSDVEQIARALRIGGLGLPYWFWGIACGAASVAVLWHAIRPLAGSAAPTE